MQRSLFTPREHFKPFCYPELEEFCDAIGESYWTHKEWSFATDIQEFHSELSDYEREIVKKCLLLISQVEVSLKTFFLKIGDHLPKPEVFMVGATFAESEVRHERAYSHLLELLGLNEEFEKIYDIPVIIDRHNYLKKYKDFESSNSKDKFLKSVILFSLFIENVSLFTQFLVLMSFNKHRKKLKDINNAVSATSKEENIHASFGSFIVNDIRKSNPELFTKELEKMVNEFAQKALVVECKIIDWVFDKGGLDFINVDEVKEFTKDRLNQSLVSIKYPAAFDVDVELLKKVKWFNEGLISDSHFDFFHQRPISYSRKNKPITADDLF